MRFVPSPRVPARAVTSRSRLSVLVPAARGETMLTGHEVRTKTFHATKWREGYDVADVTAVLERAAAALDAVAAGHQTAGLLTASELLGAKFRATKFRAGCDQDEVDDFLDVVVGALKAAGGPVSA